MAPILFLRADHNFLRLILHSLHVLDGHLDRPLVGPELRMPAARANLIQDGLEGLLPLRAAVWNSRRVGLEHRPGLEEEDLLGVRVGVPVQGGSHFAGGLRERLLQQLIFLPIKLEGQLDLELGKALTALTRKVPAGANSILDFILDLSCGLVLRELKPPRPLGGTEGGKYCSVSGLAMRVISRMADQWIAPA
jgi:hypothetical protein